MNGLCIIAGIHEIAYLVRYGEAEIEVLEPLDPPLCTEFYCQLQGNGYELRRLRVSYEENELLFNETKRERLELRPIMLEIMEAVREQQENLAAEAVPAGGDE